MSEGTITPSERTSERVGESEASAAPPAAPARTPPGGPSQEQEHICERMNERTSKALLWVDACSLAHLLCFPT